jgi:glycosyltransferase involved in cell wall biosynthesis
MSTVLDTRPIVLFSARYLPNVGGVEFFTANLGDRLAAMGYDVTVVTTEATDSPAEDARHHVGEGTLEVVRFDAWGAKRVPFAKRSRRNKALLTYLEQKAPFHALINTRFYDLSYLGARLCNRVGVRPVLIEHGTGYIKFNNKLLAPASKLAEHTVALRLKRYPIDFYGISKRASQWLKTFGITSCGEIHNALDSAAFAGNSSSRDFRTEFHVDEKAMCVVFASRLVADKGADVMLEAASALRGDERIRFFIAGSGPLEDDIRTAGAELPNLSYVGMLNHADLASLLVSSDVFCLPSNSEGLPTSLLEAAACSCALVASRVGGVDEIMPTSEQGIVLERTESAELVRVLKELADNPERLASLKSCAHDYIKEHFSWDNTVSELLEAFNRASSSTR